MKSTIRIDVSPHDNRPVISIKSITSSDDLRDKALINFLSPIEIKRAKGKATFLHIQHKSTYVGLSTDCGDDWEVTSFPRDIATLDQIEGMYKLLCFQTGTNFAMCNDGSNLSFENIDTGKRSANMYIDNLEEKDYHTLAKEVEENFKSIIVKSKK